MNFYVFFNHYYGSIFEFTLRINPLFFPSIAQERTAQKANFAVRSSLFALSLRKSGFAQSETLEILTVNFAKLCVLYFAIWLLQIYFFQITVTLKVAVRVQRLQIPILGFARKSFFSLLRKVKIRVKLANCCENMRNISYQKIFFCSHEIFFDFEKVFMKTFLFWEIFAKFFAITKLVVFQVNWHEKLLGRYFCSTINSNCQKKIDFQNNNNSQLNIPKQQKSIKI